MIIDALRDSLSQLIGKLGISNPVAVQKCIELALLVCLLALFQGFGYILVPKHMFIFFMSFLERREKSGQR